IGLSAALLVIALAILPFLTPAWVSFEQGRTNAAALTGYTTAELGTATDAILHDLVIGPPDFTVQVNGSPVLEERERSHMRDVRGVFAEFYGLAILAAIPLVALVVRAYRAGRPAAAWHAVGAGMRWLIVGVVVAGVIVTVTVAGRIGSLQPDVDAVLPWLIGLAGSLGFMATVVAHELGHAVVARRDGAPGATVVVHFIGSPNAIDVVASSPREEAKV